MNSQLLAEPAFASAVLDAAKQDHGEPNLADGSGSGAAGLMPVVNGIAIVDIAGAILHRTGRIHPTLGATGIDGLRVRLSVAEADPQIKGILLNVNSGGGQVGGVFDAADSIREMKTPMWALVDETAASAAYALASAADRVVLPRTGRAGSIGVVLAHVDQSKALEQAGLSVSLIHAGQHKVDAHPFGPLSEQVRQDLQSSIDTTYSLFTATVARQRGLDDEAVRRTEARVYTGQEAIDAGLADEVMPAREALPAFEAHLRGQRSNTSRTVAAKPKTQPTMQDFASSFWQHDNEQATSKTLNAVQAHEG